MTLKEVLALSDEQLNIKVAELSGKYQHVDTRTSVVDYGSGRDHYDLIEGYYYDGTDGNGEPIVHIEEIPDYIYRGLEEMHEVVRGLGERKKGVENDVRWVLYIDTLKDITGCWSSAVEATAKQRAIAFVVAMTGDTP